MLTCHKKLKNSSFSSRTRCCWIHWTNNLLSSQQRPSTSQALPRKSKASKKTSGTSQMTSQKIGLPPEVTKWLWLKTALFSQAKTPGRPRRWSIKRLRRWPHSSSARRSSRSLRSRKLIEEWNRGRRVAQRAKVPLMMKNPSMFPSWIRSFRRTWTGTPSFSTMWTRHTTSKRKKARRTFLRSASWKTTQGPTIKTEIGLATKARSRVTSRDHLEKLLGLWCLQPRC